MRVVSVVRVVYGQVHDRGEQTEDEAHEEKSQDDLCGRALPHLLLTVERRMLVRRLDELSLMQQLEDLCVLSLELLSVVDHRDATHVLTERGAVEACKGRLTSDPTHQS